mmetsp:Transcript_128024/g.410214  ORF Transcript_128024/g.410214 Transcript_128024/m.410214 type:complete len:226 (-) Transcript_128024:488-1165(-)
MVRRWPNERLHPIMHCISVMGDESQVSFPSPAAAPAVQSPKVQWKVHNTFIHCAPQPPTPLAGSRPRSQSLNLDHMGADQHSTTACDSEGSTADDGAGSAAGECQEGPSSPLSRAFSSKSLPPHDPTLESEPCKVKFSRLDSMQGLSESSPWSGPLTQTSRPLFGCPPLGLDEMLHEPTSSRLCVPVGTHSKSPFVPSTPRGLLLIPPTPQSSLYTRRDWLHAST